MCEAGVRLDVGGFSFWRVFKGAPLESVIAPHEWGGDVGFLGVYPLGEGYFEAKVFQGRRLYSEVASRGRGLEVSLNFVADPEVLWLVYRGVARASECGGYMVVPGAFMVVRALVHKLSQDSDSMHLILKAQEALVLPVNVSGYSRLTGALVELMVALTRVGVYCSSEESLASLADSFRSSLRFLRKYLEKSGRTQLLDEIMGEVERVVSKCPKLGELIG